MEKSEQENLKGEESIIKTKNNSLTIDDFFLITVIG